MDRGYLARVKKQRSDVMRAVKSAGNKSTEIIVTRTLKELGIRYWASHSRDIEGKPDFIFRKKRIVIFVDGCFWHGCKIHCRLPSSNKDYWNAKIERNSNRDKIVNKNLRKKGWKVIRIWEHSLKKSQSDVRKRLKKILINNHILQTPI